MSNPMVPVVLIAIVVLVVWWVRLKAAEANEAARLREEALYGRRYGSRPAHDAWQCRHVDGKSCTNCR